MAQSGSQICRAIAESTKESSVEKPGENKTHHSLCRRASQHIVPPVSIFPALSTIVIEGADFRQRYSPEGIEYLVDMLMKRSNMNAPIDRLILEACSGVRKFQKRRLGELVVRLDVDGEEVHVEKLVSDDEWGDEEEYSDEEEEDYYSYGDLLYDDYPYYLDDPPFG